MQALIKTINGWTKKKMLNHIKKNFAGKSLLKVRSLEHPEVDCAYRGADGAKCAIGMFIPDILYRAEMEGKGAHVLCGMEPKLKSKLPLEPYALTYLQEVHDDSEPDETLNSVMRWVETNVR